MRRFEDIVQYSFGMLQPQRSFEAATGEVIGFVLDSPFVVNDDFEDEDLTGWILTSPNVSLDVSGGKLEITSTTAWSGCVKTFTLVPGETYRVRYAATLISGTGIQSSVYDGSTMIWNSHSPYYPGSPADYTFVAAGTSGNINFASTYSAGIIHVDYFTLQKISPDTIPVREGSGYRFGFNTQLKVDEIAGKNNHYTAKFWEYDPRAVLRWNVDPVTKPWESPYMINSGNPIWYSDPNGDDGEVKTDEQGCIEYIGDVIDNNGNELKVDGMTNQQMQDMGYNANMTTSPATVVGDKRNIFEKTGDAYNSTKLEMNDFMMSDPIGFGKINTKKGSVPNRVMKGIIGITPHVFVPNAIRVLTTEKDFYGEEASSTVDKVVAGAALIAPFNLGAKASKALIGKETVGKIIDNINGGVQITNDVGLLDPIKTQENDSTQKE